jgi:hypothetical protein
MKKTRFSFLFLLTILLLPVSLGAFDFGLLTGHFFELENDGEEYFYEYNGYIVPRLSFFFGETGSFYTSAKFSVMYDDEIFYVPEILRTELAIRFGGFGIKTGRFFYSDPLDFIVSGLFDGLQFSHTSRLGQFSLGAWYTGLL